MPGIHELPDGMPDYDRAMWRHLQEHWTKKANRRKILPPKAKSALETAGRRSREVVSQAGEKLGEHTPEPIKKAGEFVLDGALVPTAKAAAHLLELVEDWAAELPRDRASIPP
jgi:hypothetical protein